MYNILNNMNRYNEKHITLVKILNLLGVIN